MKTIRIQGAQRADLGKRATRALRQAERIPCVIYGGGVPVHFSVEPLAFKDLVYTPDAHFVHLQLGDAQYEAILQDLQFHPVTDAILHADFYRLQGDKPISMHIPVQLKGRSRGVTAGGSLNLYMRRLKVRAVPEQMPEAIEIDITLLRIGDKKYVAELQKGTKHEFLHPDNAVVVAVRRSRAAMSIGAGLEEEAQGEKTAEG